MSDGGSAALTNGTTPGVTRRAASLPRGRLHHLQSHRAPGQEYFAYVPASGGDHAPVFVAVHGISRNVHEHASLFAPLCEKVGAVLLAPFFPSDRCPDYQRLGRLGRGPRSDQALDTVVDEIGGLTGTRTDRLLMFGFSGGAQFVHRYTMAHPHRVARAVSAAAGWYTFPDRRLRYPYGMGRTRELPEVRFDPEEFLRVPITVIVGEQDVSSLDLRSTDRVIRQQGVTRLDRARNWVAAMQAAAEAHHLEPLVRLETIPGGDHTFMSLMLHGGLGERAFAALFGPLPSRPRRSVHG